MLKAADAKKDTKTAGLQALANNSLERMNIKYEDLIEGSSQRTIFRSIKTTRAMDKFAQQTPKE